MGYWVYCANALLAYAVYSSVAVDANTLTVSLTVNLSIQTVFNTDSVDHVFTTCTDTTVQGCIPLRKDRAALTDAI